MLDKIDTFSGNAIAIISFVFMVYCLISYLMKRFNKKTVFAYGILGEIYYGLQVIIATAHNNWGLALSYIGFIVVMAMNLLYWKTAWSDENSQVEQLETADEEEKII